MPALPDKARGKTKQPTKKGGTKKGPELVYAEPYSVIALGPTAITFDGAKELLGWEDESEGADFKDDYLLYDYNGVKARCSRNVKNRPLAIANVAVLKQEILRKRWKFNGEPIIVGNYGHILNGQHSLIAFILAVQEWRGEPDLFPDWEEEPTIDKVITFGVPEDDETVNTMDTCKPRSLSDVLYRAQYFKDMKKADQVKVSTQLANAIKKLWERSGVFEDPYSISSTHSELISFLGRHQKLLDAVRHVYEEDESQKISKYINRGYAAAALYLMGSSASDTDRYYKADHPGEELLDWTHWDRACTFFVELASGAKSLAAIPKYLGQVTDDHNGAKIPQSVFWAVVVKAWNLYREQKPVTVENLFLAFEFKDDRHHLAESPYIGGLDVGEEGLPFEEIAQGEIDARATAERTPQVASKSHVMKNKVEKSVWKKGDTAWMLNEFEEPTFVTLKDEPYRGPDQVERVLVDADGAAHTALVENLSLSQHELG